MKVVSLFAGCGGLDLGLVKSGHKIVHASDIDSDCCETYSRNLGHKCHCIDVKMLDTSNLPKYDLLVGGFPCQGFSVANLYRSGKDERNELYLQIVRILNQTMPKFFLAENVPGILSLEKGKVVEMIINDFKNVGKPTGFCGYDVKMFKLNAANYGAPQNRHRVIFVGISNSFSVGLREKMFSFFPPKYTHGVEKMPLRTIKDAIGDLPDPSSKEGSKIANHYTTNHKVKINGYLGNRKLDWNKPSPTIVGRGGGTGGPVIAVHPNLKRRLSVRETARLQGFDDSFIFSGSKSSQYRQIGNAVAVDFAFALGKALKKVEKLVAKSS